MAEASAELPLTTPDADTGNHTIGPVQPLDPGLLQGLEIENLRRPLTPDETLAHNAWFRRIEHLADAHLRPQVVDARTERAFAHFVARGVRGEVAIDAVGYHNEVFSPRGVDAAIDEYYERFPSSGEASGTKITYQGFMLRHADRARTKEHPQRFMEVGVVLGLQRAFIRERMPFPTRATFAVLSSYGAAVHAAKQTEQY